MASSTFATYASVRQLGRFAWVARSIIAKIITVQYLLMRFIRLTTCLDANSCEVLFTECGLMLEVPLDEKTVYRDVRPEFASFISDFQLSPICFHLITFSASLEGVVSASRGF